MSAFLSTSLTCRPIREGINWSLMAFSSGSNNLLISGTVLRKWVHLEHYPLVNAEYAAWGSSCAYFESNWMSFTQSSTLFLMNCSLNDSVPITASRWRSPWSVILMPVSSKSFLAAFCKYFFFSMRIVLWAFGPKVRPLALWTVLKVRPLALWTVPPFCNAFQRSDCRAIIRKPYMFHFNICGSVLSAYTSGRVEIAYIAIYLLSPCVTPSCDSNANPFLVYNVAGVLYLLCRYVYRGGHTLNNVF